MCELTPASCVSALIFGCGAREWNSSPLPYRPLPYFAGHFLSLEQLYHTLGSCMSCVLALLVDPLPSFEKQLLRYNSSEPHTGVRTTYFSLSYIIEMSVYILATSECQNILCLRTL